jgi:hypothetical protein
MFAGIVARTWRKWLFAFTLGLSAIALLALVDKYVIDLSTTRADDIEHLAERLISETARLVSDSGNQRKHAQLTLTSRRTCPLFFSAIA